MAAGAVVTRDERIPVVCGRCRMVQRDGLVREHGWSMWSECPRCRSRFRGSRAVLPYLAYTRAIIDGHTEAEAVDLALARLDEMPEPLGEEMNQQSETSLAIAAREGMWAARVFCKDADWHHLMDWCPPCGYEGEGVIPAMPEPACSVLTAGPVDREAWRP